LFKPLLSAAVAAIRAALSWLWLGRFLQLFGPSSALAGLIAKIEATDRVAR
jgi:hypothetical protein